MLVREMCALQACAMDVRGEREALPRAVVVLGGGRDGNSGDGGGSGGRW